MSDANINYDNPIKRTYRTRREGAISQFCTIPIKLRRVAYLDTGSALDTIFRLEQGYSPCNLYPVNKNPAEVAHLTMKLRKQGLPDVNTRGVSIGSGFDRGVIPTVDVIDFDGMYVVGHEMTATLQSLVKSGARVLAVTLLGGREQRFHGTLVRHWPARDKSATVTTSFGSQVRSTHLSRIGMTFQHAQSVYDSQGVGSCIAHITDAKWDVYVSENGSPMVWGVAQLRPHRDLWGDKGGPYMSINRRCFKMGVVPPCLIADEKSLSDTIELTHRYHGGLERKTNELPRFLEGRMNTGRKKLAHSGLW